MATWPAGRSLVRAHPSDYGATEFDARTTGTNNRFSPLIDRKRAVPVIYGAADERAAASETIFHTVPAPDNGEPEMRPRAVFLDPYLAWMWSSIAPTRDLRLVNLRGRGLEALGVRRRDLILSDRRAYPTARQWALALYRQAETADGFWWTSRQHPGADAVLLLGRRSARPGGLARSDLSVVDAPQAFLSDAGLERLLEAGQRLGITVIAR